jgi:TRAP-type C4-dicarboxylate transport system permease small subunit
MKYILDILKTIDTFNLKLTKTIALTSFFLLTILITANVFIRFFPIISLHWFDEIIELLVAFMVFYGSAALWITKEHFCIGDWLEKRIEDVRMKHLYKLLLEVVTLVFAAVFFYYSFKLLLKAHDVTNVFAIPKKVLYSCLPISGAIMIVLSLSLKGV